MAKRISKEQAMDRLHEERRSAGCLMCALRDGAAGPRLSIAEDSGALVLLSRYGVRRGHVIVIAADHVTSFDEFGPRRFLALASSAFRAARAVEKVLAPLRCYVASLGAPHDDVPMSSRHLHFNVVPLFDRDDRPSTVLTWEGGVLESTDDENESLRDALARAYACVT